MMFGVLLYFHLYLQFGGVLGGSPCSLHCKEGKGPALLL